MVRLVGTGNGDAEVVGLGLAEGGELDVELANVGTGDLLVESLGEDAAGQRGLRIGWRLTARREGMTWRRSRGRSEPRPGWRTSRT